MHNHKFSDNQTQITTTDYTIQNSACSENSTDLKSPLKELFTSLIRCEMQVFGETICTVIFFFTSRIKIPNKSFIAANFCVMMYPSLFDLTPRWRVISSVEKHDLSCFKAFEPPGRGYLVYKHTGRCRWKISKAALSRSAISETDTLSGE